MQLIYYELLNSFFTMESVKCYYFFIEIQITIIYFEMLRITYINYSIKMVLPQTQHKNENGEIKYCELSQNTFL